MRFAIVQFIALGLLICGIAGLVTGRFRLHKPVKDFQCRACGYPIAGLTRPQCPECGAALGTRTIASPADPRPTTLRFVLNCVGWVFASGLVAMVAVGIVLGLLGQRLVERHLVLNAPGLEVTVAGTGGRAYQDGVRPPHELTISVRASARTVTRSTKPDADPSAHEGVIRELLAESGSPRADEDGVVADIAITAAHLSGGAGATASGIAVGAVPTPTTLGAGGGGYSMTPAAWRWSEPARLAAWVVLLVIGEYFIWRDYARRRVAAAKADAEIARVMSGWADAVEA